MTEINSDNNNSCSNQQRILITGASGLVGRVLFHYLMKTYPTKYQVFGLDQHTNVSTRYKPNEAHLVEAIKPIPSDKFFQCDITDRTKLFQIIEEQKIDFIIHLAAVLEMHPDIQKISDVNINGTKNIFEARQLSFT
jgi:nucleoside-diphosphate-sugar epimerase